MHLIWATEDYQLSGRPLAGMPILLWDTMESCIPVNDFYRSHLTRAQISSGDSWNATGQALYDFFSFLQAHNLDWWDVDREESKTLLSAYRDYCFTEHNHGRNTVRHRMHYVCKFYEYAYKRNWISNLPHDFEVRSAKTGSGFLAHVDARGNKVKANDAMPRKLKTLPKYLTRDQIKALISSIQNVHHRMLVSFALRTGLRRMELATIPIDYIKKALRDRGKTRNIFLRLDPSDGFGIKTKRGTIRDVYVSRKFLLQVDQYITQHRGERCSLGAGDSVRLFLNQNGQPYANEGKGLEKIVRDIGKKIGLDVHPHMLRHSYATHTLISLQRSRLDLDPLIYLSSQLGHSSIETTRIYLHIANDYVDNAVLQYDDELNEIGSADG